MKKSKFKRDIIWCIMSMFFVSIMLTSVLTFSLIPVYAEETDTGDADRKEYGNHIYQKYELPLDWYEAKAFCESIGGHLATITSKEEQAVVDSLLRNGSKNSYWIGGNKDSKGHWRWITSEDFIYTNWSYAQPDKNTYTSSEGEDVLMIYKNSNPKIDSELGEWNDLYHDGTCGNEEFFGLQNLGFICEWENRETYVEDGVHTYTYVITAPSNKTEAGKKLELKVKSDGKIISNTNFIWKSSNVKFATVDKKGVVTTKKAGVGKRVTITATLKNGGDIATSINISIRDNSSISLSKNSIILSLAGTRTATLKATVRNTSEKVVWKTSNGQVVDVKDGKLKATGRGTAIVSAKVSGKTAQCRVTVKDTAVKTVTYKFRTLEEWDKTVSAKEKGLTFGNQAFLPNGTSYHTGNIIVKREVLTYKKVPVKISLNTPGYYRTAYLRLPEKVKYTLHRHSLQIDGSSESIGKLIAGLVDQQVVWTQTCSCGFKNELSWDIPIDKMNKLEAEQTYTVKSISRAIDT